jgi:hypothetical protein
VDNSVVYNWDTGKSVPTLAHLVNLREVLGRWTADELLYGRDVPRQRTAGGHIDHTMVIDALNALEASADTRQAVALHLESPDGRYQEITREYVLRFAQVYALERANGRSAFESGRVAYAEAVNQSALASAVAGGLVQPKAAPRARRPSRRLPTTRSRAS